MRDLTKSAISFGWAMSIFGMRQFTEAFIPGRTAVAADSFEPVTQAAVDTFGEALKVAFQVGDALQRGAIDAMFNLLSGRGFSLDQFLSPEARQQAATASQEAAAAQTSGTLEQGWGPVPGGREGQLPF